MFGNVIEKIMYRIVVFYDAHIDKQQVRFMLLIVAGGFGLLVGSFADIQFFRDYLGRIKKSLNIWLPQFLVFLYLRFYGRWLSCVFIQRNAVGRCAAFG